MYKIRIVCVGSLKDDFYVEAQKEYKKRLSRFCNLEIIEKEEYKLPLNPSSSEITRALDKEYEIIKPYLKGKIIVLDKFGKLTSSEEFSNELFEFFSFDDTVTFVIGSSYGLSDKIKSNYKLSFSKMTFPHTLFRIMLEEQLYRAFTIKNNITYHK